VVGVVDDFLKQRVIDIASLDGPNEVQITQDDAPQRRPVLYSLSHSDVVIVIGDNNIHARGVLVCNRFSYGLGFYYTIFTAIA
jgi:hypothetical protein